MTGTQLYLALGVPILSNAAMIGVMIMNINSRCDSVNQEMKGLHEDVREMRSDIKLLTARCTK
jgi:hypothetical protein